jgi:predicted nucleotidyltransferase
MDRDEVIDRLRRSDADLRRLGVKSLRLFGSVARGEATDKSDVDLLVAFDGPATFSGFMALKIFIEDLLGRRVDLVTETGLREGVRPHIEREAIRIA